MAAETIALSGKTSPVRGGLGVTSRTAVITVGAALEAGDKWDCFTLPEGALPLLAVITATDLDTHTTPTLTFDLGFDGDTDAFIDGATVGQAANGATNNVVTGFDSALTADDIVTLEAKTGPATGASSGTIVVTVIYTMDNALSTGANS